MLLSSLLEMMRSWRAWNITQLTLLVWPRSVSTSHALLSAGGQQQDRNMACIRGRDNKEEHGMSGNGKAGQIISWLLTAVQQCTIAVPTARLLRLSLVLSSPSTSVPAARH
jgi:hypothetical protein